MKKRLLLQNAIWLSLTAFTLRGAGMAFRVYLANQIGDEGIGLYQLIFTLYNLCITLATSGVSVASTRLVAGWLAQNKGSPAILAKKVVRYSFCTGAFSGILLFVCAGPASKWILQDTRAIIPLRILAFSLPFMAAGAALRGCFSACRQVKSSSVSQLFEQAVRIGLVAYLLPRAPIENLALSCSIIVLGNTLSEILSALWIQISWKCYMSRTPAKPSAPLQSTFSAYCSLGLPVAATRGVSSLLVTAENVLVPAMLGLFLADRTEALASFGRLKGMALPVLFFPFSLLATFSTLLLPEITHAHIKGDRAALCRLIKITLQITCILSLLVGGLITIFSAPLGQLLYQSEEIGFYLRILGPLAPFMYLESMVDGMLRGMDEQLATFRYSLLDSAVRIAGVLILVPRFGMKGFLFVMLLSNLTTCLLNLCRLVQVSHLHLSLSTLVLKPLFSLLAGWAAWHFVMETFFTGIAHFSGFMLLCAGSCTVGGIYLIFLWITGCVSLQDFAFLKRKKNIKPVCGKPAVPHTLPCVLFF